MIELSNEEFVCTRFSKLLIPALWLVEHVPSTKFKSSKNWVERYRSKHGTNAPYLIIKHQGELTVVCVDEADASEDVTLTAEGEYLWKEA